MTGTERDLWKSLGYAYECYRCGYPKEDCERLANNYIEFYKNWKWEEWCDAAGKG